MRPKRSVLAFFTAAAVALAVVWVFQASVWHAEAEPSAMYAAPSVPAGTTLSAGQIVLSPSKQYRLVMQADGNLVLYTKNRALWATNTDGNPGARATMQTDGNLVVYTSAGKAIWASSTVGTGNRGLYVEDYATLVIRTSTGTAVWEAGSRNARLPVNERLTSGQSIYSPNLQYRLIMQSDGNFVLYTQGRALWNTGTHGHPGAWVVMQSDGNLVVYAQSGTALWASRTVGQGGRSLYLQDDANAVIYTTAWQAVWASNTGNAVLADLEWLNPGQCLYSPDRAQCFIMQGDGNLVLYRRGAARWNSHTSGHPGARLVLQNDGNLVIYSPTGQALWASWTQGRGPSRLVVQDDGNVVIYTTAGKATWATNTVVSTPSGGNVRPNLSSGAYYNPPNRFPRGECTWFAWGRALEKCGVSLALSAPAHAGTWLSKAKAVGYATGTTPRANSVVVWQKADTVGHVGFIEAVDGGVVTLNEANWLTHNRGGGYDGAPKYLTVGQLNRNGYVVVGYIYVGLSRF